jgi:hypothetical protein
MAGKGEVVRIIGTAVLPGHDVFDVVGQVGVALVEPAVFATGPSPLSHQLPRGRIHSLCGICLN